MQIKLNEIVGSAENIKALLEVKLPVKIAYRLSKLVNKLQPSLSIYEENRNKLIKEYGTEQEDGNIAVKDPEKLKLFAVELGKLLEVEESVEFEKIKIEDLGEIEIAPNLLVNFLFE